MDDVAGISKYLIERAKKEIESVGILHKFYFIMRYPGKDKPVYSPLNIDFGITEYYKLPERIHLLWDKRKANSPPGTKLLAVCSVHNCIYEPTSKNKPFVMRPGHLVITCTIHEANRRRNLVVFYSVTPDGVTFYNDACTVDSGTTDIDVGMFPGNAQ